jgi:hypothetical protein
MKKLFLATIFLAFGLTGRETIRMWTTSSFKKMNVVFVNTADIQVALKVRHHRCPKASVEFTRREKWEGKDVIALGLKGTCTVPVAGR